MRCAGQREPEREAGAADSAAVAEDGAEQGAGATGTAQHAASHAAFWTVGPEQLVRFAPELLTTIPTHGPALLHEAGIQDAVPATVAAIPAFDQLICPRLTAPSMKVWVKDANKCKRLLAAVDHLHHLVNHGGRTMTFGECLAVVFTEDMATVVGDATLFAKAMANGANWLSDILGFDEKVCKQWCQQTTDKVSRRHAATKLIKLLKAAYKHGEDEKDESS